VRANSDELLNNSNDSAASWTVRWAVRYMR